MRKQPEAEDHIKSTIRDVLALHPFAAINNIQRALYRQGYRTASNLMLDWHYVSKLVKKVRQENLQSLKSEDRQARVAMFKERHRIVTDEMANIMAGKPIINIDGVFHPTHRDRIDAANTILKYDVAMLVAEGQISAAQPAMPVQAEPIPLAPKPTKRIMKRIAEALPALLSGN